MERGFQLSVRISNRAVAFCTMDWILNQVEDDGFELIETVSRYVRLPSLATEEAEFAPNAPTSLKFH